ncbi:GrpB family protein [Paenibacillus sp. GSMTC-2017]|uniref:GrpB family protein n=1 Tax=Paenibacillus sp. GSMTC-2017 TaxID=2794350 RepID=UPI0018D6B216|nr:GrpB family protein [Paenibacillus sp. GSMTC-2017]
MDKVVVLEHYNSDWALKYDQEKELMLMLLGKTVIAIEHIGSTAINGLSAKPIIDFMIGVNDLADVKLFIEPLAAVGYEHVYHPQFPNRRFFRKGERNAGTYHLHVYQYGREKWEDLILFRDYLITHSDVREQYSQLKKELAEKYYNDRSAYTTAKTPFIIRVVEIARKELTEK